MASLIPGYEYDIFISYRQKDNKGDRWVSEFVEALKNELESTFKEEISVYFDINPHDGLLETHDVDASLKEKLKCLVFIPVLSRTYCDIKSFAWKNEFETFVEQASHDKYGLKVRLPDGKFASRVLPVRIHDLDSDDITLCESVLGGTPGGVEFIYKSPGVNRPLRSTEEKQHENLNKTVYRDQLNKTALAIKEIILGLKGETDIKVNGSSYLLDQKQETYKNGKFVKPVRKKLLIGAGILAILIFAAILTLAGLLKNKSLERLKSKDGKIPITVMPFRNMTNDTTWNVWQDGIQNILITNLSNSEDLKVRQFSTITDFLQNEGVTNYASLTPSVAGSISKKLETNVLIMGSLKKSGGTIRVNSQLIDAKTGEAFKSFQIDGTSDSLLPVIDSLSSMVQEFLLISVMKKELKLNVQNFEKEYVVTTSPEAFRYFMLGSKAFSKNDMPTARDWYLKAVGIDSNFATVYNWLCYTYLNQGMYEQGKKWCLKLYRMRDHVTRFQKIVINQCYAHCFETPAEELKYLKQQKEMDDLSGACSMLGIIYSSIGQYDKAIPEFEKDLGDQIKLYSKPWWPYDYFWLARAHIRTSQYKKGKNLLKDSEKYFPNDPGLTSQKAIISLAVNDTIEANRYINKYISLCKDRSDSEASIAEDLAWIYSEASVTDKTDKYYRQALLLTPEIPYRMNNLARFLINKDRNVNEGLELINKALTLRPDNYEFLDTKGWGLYKQEKYKEALDILQKSWDLRRQKALYDHEAFLHLEAARKAVSGQK